MTGQYHGSCLCGAVKFEIDEFLPLAAHCHCSMCRKFHGAAYATLVGVLRSKFRWVAGAQMLKGFTAQNGTTRTFCGNCGASLTFCSPRAPAEQVEVALGAMDGDLPVEPSAHIFVESAPSWVLLNDDLPKYAQGRGSANVKR